MWVGGGGSLAGAVLAGLALVGIGYLIVSRDRAREERDAAIAPTASPEADG
jgi:hypothetical protein